MKVMIACEFSGIVREAFANEGHYVVSCDLLPSEKPNRATSYHVQRDAVDLIYDYDLLSDFDLLIAFPPCTYLASSGARWWQYHRNDQLKAIQFVNELISTAVPRYAIENPIGILSTIWRRPDQIIQPWMFGHGETKATCLWLKNLPLLKPTNIVDGRQERIHHLSALRGPGSSKTRKQDRSRTFWGIAQAMAAQWGACAAQMPLNGK